MTYIPQTVDIPLSTKQVTNLRTMLHLIEKASTIIHGDPHMARDDKVRALGCLARCKKRISAVLQTDLFSQMAATVNTRLHRDIQGLVWRTGKLISSDGRMATATKTKVKGPLEEVQRIVSDVLRLESLSPSQLGT